MSEDLDANASQEVLVVLEGFFAEAEKEEENEGGDRHNPEEKEELPLVRDRIDDHGNSVDATEVRMYVCPVSPWAEARRDVVVHGNGRKYRLPNDLDDRHRNQTQVPPCGKCGAGVFELHSERKALPEEVVERHRCS